MIPKISLYQGEAKVLPIRISGSNGLPIPLENSKVLLAVNRLVEDEDPIFVKDDGDFIRVDEGNLAVALNPWDTWREPWTYKAQLQIIDGGVCNKFLFDIEIIQAISPSDFTILAKGLSSDEAFGNLIVNSSTIGAGGLESEESFGALAVYPPTITIRFTIAAQGIASGESIGMLILSPQPNYPASIGPTEALGLPVVSVSENIINYVISVSGVPSQEIFGFGFTAPHTVAPAPLAGEEDFGDPIISADVTFRPAGIDTQEEFGTLLLLPVSIIPGSSSIISQEAFGLPVLSTSVPGPIKFTLVPSTIGSQEIFGQARLSPQTIQLIGHVPQEAFGNLVVSVSDFIVRQILIPSSIFTAESFGTRTKIQIKVRGKKK